MKITIQKESSVPIRDQLIEQLGLQIAAGILKHNEKLPSIRALAQRLDIHYSTVTAAYNHLAEAGLLEIRQGSGVRVATPSSGADGGAKENTLNELVAEFFSRVAEKGFSQKQVLSAVENLCHRQPVRRLLVVDRNPDFHPILLAELKPHFSIPVEICTIEQLKQENYDDALIVTSLYHVFAFQNLVSDATRLVVCNIEPARNELETVALLPKGSLVLLVSPSETIFKMASKLIAATRGEEVAVRTVMPSDQKELHYMLKHANLVMCDKSSEKEVVANAGKTKTLVFQLFSPSTIASIKDRLSKWG